MNVFSCFQRWFTALLLLLMWITQRRFGDYLCPYSTRHAVTLKYFHLQNHRPLVQDISFVDLLLHLHANVRMSIMSFFMYRYSMNILIQQPTKIIIPYCYLGHFTPFSLKFLFLSQFVFMLTGYYCKTLDLAQFVQLLLCGDTLFTGKALFRKTPENEPNSL